MGYWNIMINELLVRWLIYELVCGIEDIFCVYLVCGVWGEGKGWVLCERKGVKKLNVDVFYLVFFS